jgi:hypothetical protein
MNDRTPQILVTEAVYPGTIIKINTFELTIQDEQSYASRFTKGAYGVVRKKYE